MKNILETKNKKGLAPLVVVLIIIGIIAAVAVIYGTVKQAQISPEEDEAREAEIEKCYLDPVITISGLNTLKPGTAVTLTGTQAIVNDEYIGAITSGTTSFNFGDEVELLAGAADYLNVTTDPITIKCGENKVVAKLYGTDAGTLGILDSTYTAPTNIATNAAALNVTSVAGVVNAIVTLRGTADDNTGILLVTVETNTTQVDKITVAPKSASAVILNDDFPVSDLTLMGTDEFSGSSIKYGFLVDQLLDGSYAEYEISFYPESGITIGEGDAQYCPVYVNVYSSQAGVDIDGTFKSGLADEPMFEDEDGTVIYEDAWTDYDFLIE